MTEQERAYIEKMYLEYYETLHHYAYVTLKNHFLAEDVVHECFRVLCARATDFVASPNPHGWMIYALKHTLQNTQRSIARMYQIIVDVDWDEELKDLGAPDALRIELLYGDLMQTQEFKIIMALVHGKSTAQLAKEIGVSQATCRKRIQRAKEYLRRELEL